MPVVMVAVAVVVVKTVMVVMRGLDGEAEQRAALPSRRRGRKFFIMFC